MADEKQVEMLLRSVEEWNQWREENPDVEPELSNANLYRAKLDGANLVDANLRGATLIGANLSYAKLIAATLIDANLYRANLSRWL